MELEKLNITLSPPRRKLVAVSAMLLYVNIMCITFSINIILPRMMAELGGMELYAFASVMNSVGIMLAAPVAGKLGDRVGRKWITVGALGAQLLMFAGVSLSRTLPVFFLFYTLAAIFGGLFISAPHAIIADVIPTAERSHYYGFLSAAGAVGGLIGPPVCGLLVDAGVFRAAYWVGWPLGCVCLVLLTVLYPNAPRGSGGEKVDFLGLGLLVAAVGALASYINFGGSLFSWFSPTGLIILVVGLGSGALFFRVEKRAPHPIVALDLFRHRRFSLAWIGRFLFTFYLMAASAYVVLYGQKVLGLSATLSSTLAMPQTIIMLVVSPIIGRLVSRSLRNYRRCYMLMGLCTAIPLFLWSLMRPDTPILVVYFGMLLGGVAYATEQTISTPYFQLSIPKESYGAAQGMSFFASSAGGTLAGAIYGAILSQGELAVQIKLIFRVGGCVMFLILLMAFFLIERGKES